MLQQKERTAKMCDGFTCLPFPPWTVSVVATDLNDMKELSHSTELFGKIGLMI